MNFYGFWTKLLLKQDSCVITQNVGQKMREKLSDPINDEQICGTFVSAVLFGKCRKLRKNYQKLSYFRLLDRMWIVSSYLHTTVVQKNNL